MYVFKFYPVCHFGEFINFGLCTVRSERVQDGAIDRNGQETEMNKHLNESAGVHNLSCALLRSVLK